MLFNLLTIVILVVCVLLILIVLVQNSKGGGLSSSFASNNQIVGVRKTADFLEKATWTLVIALLALSLISSSVIPRSNAGQGRSKIQDKVDAAPLFENPAQTPPPPIETE